MQFFLHRKIGQLLKLTSKNEVSRSYIAIEGILTAAEGLQHAQ